MWRLPRHNRSQEELRELINDNKPLDRKKVIIRLTAFLILLGLAVTFITLGITRGGVKEGLQTIEAPLDETVPLYQLGVSFQHYFSGGTGEIRLGVRQLSELYAAALKDAYRILDPEELYEGWANLATLNQNLGREVTVNRELYEVLKDALRLTEEYEEYNLFAGALWTEWEGLRFALDPAEFDPARDPAEAERLARLTAATRERSHFSLEFLDDEACRLRFTVDESYLELLRELELDQAPILHLNVLQEAYRLQLTAKRLTEAGYDRGYLLSDRGILLVLPGYAEGGEFCFYGLRDEKPVPAATLPMTADSCTVQLRAFAFPEEAGYYSVEQEGRTLLRHPNLPADGVYRELLLTALVRESGRSAPETCLDCLRLFAQEGEAELTALAKTLPGAAAWLLREQPDTVCFTDSLITPAEDYGYRARLLP